MALALTTLVAATARADDWPQWRGVNRDGRSAEKGLLKQWPEKGPKLLWTAEGIGTGWSSPAAAGGLLYVTGVVDEKEFLFACDLDGHIVWREICGPAWTKTHPGSRYTPTVDGKLVFVLGSKGVLACFEARNGAKTWAVDLVEKFKVNPLPLWGFAEAPLIADELVLCTPGGREATVAALHKRSGETAWTALVAGDTSAYSSPLLVATGTARQAVVLTSGHVVGIDAAAGKVLWHHTFMNLYRDHCNTPLYHDGRIYCAAGYGCGVMELKLSADGKNAVAEWGNARLDPLHGGVVLVDGHLYGSGDRSAAWVCLDAATGDVTYEDRGIGQGSVIYADGLLYCRGYNGTVALVRPDPKGYDVVSSFKLPRGEGEHWAHPVISGGRLYLRHGNALLAYDIRAPEPPGKKKDPAAGQKTAGENGTTIRSPVIEKPAPAPGTSATPPPGDQPAVPGKTTPKPRAATPSPPAPTAPPMN